VYQTDIAITHDLPHLLDDSSWIFVLPEPQEFDTSQMVRHFRPELSLDEARQLLTLEGVRLVVGLLGIVNETAVQAARDRFAERVMKVSSEEQKQDFLFRVMAKRLGPGAAQACDSENIGLGAPF
jgi:hypothetical protein